MLLISNNLQKYMDLPKDAVIRINMAWVKTYSELETILIENKDKTVLLDYPQGRKKMPIPTLTLEDAILACDHYGNIKYFSMSNVEDVKVVLKIISVLSKNVKFVPKIETLSGVLNLKDIIKKCNIKTVALDKEDLFVDLGHKNETFFNAVEFVRVVCRECDAELLELEGVIFSNKKEIK